MPNMMPFPYITPYMFNQNIDNQLQNKLMELENRIKNLEEQLKKIESKETKIEYQTSLNMV